VKFGWYSRYPLGLFFNNALLYIKLLLALPLHVSFSWSQGKQAHWGRLPPIAEGGVFEPAEILFCG
jgi:hypothetical protein